MRSHREGETWLWILRGSPDSQVSRAFQAPLDVHPEQRGDVSIYTSELLAQCTFRICPCTGCPCFSSFLRNIHHRHAGEDLSFGLRTRRAKKEGPKRPRGAVLQRPLSICWLTKTNTSRNGTQRVGFLGPALQDVRTLTCVP